MKKSLILITLSLFYLAGFLAIGNGLSNVTGKYTLDFEGQYCSEINPCPNDQICCFFYNENAGVCSLAKNCDAIYQATKDAKNLGTISYESSTSNLRQPFSNTSYIIVGTILIVFGLFGLLNFEKHNKRRKSGKKKNN